MIEKQELKSISTNIACVFMMQVDGLALLTASLNNWMHRGPQCPHLLMSTCFHSLIQLGLISDSQLLDLLVP